MTEWEFASSEETLTKVGGLFERFARQKLLPLKDRMRFVRKESEIIPGISVIAIPGHTPGHLGLKINDGEYTLYYLADLFLHPLHVEHPDWTAKVDFNPDLVLTTRLKLLKRLATEEALVCLFHFDHPPLGRVVKSPPGWSWKKLEAS
jgi:glyoxylase-like metal-dependent hydrolase (beta-lactamase superfamily II)